MSDVDEKELATYLHDQFCKSSHMDECSWYHEVDRGENWSGVAHKKYLRKAIDLTNKFDL